MGSFNTTCFASQQTISTHNECYVIALKQSSGYNPLVVTRNGESVPATSFTSSTCYPDCFWQPVSEFIAAEYNDYGQVTLDQVPENIAKVEAFFKELPRIVYDIEQGKNQYHDIPFKLTEFQSKPLEEAWEYLWGNAVQENRLFVTGYNKNAPRNLTFGIISKQSYDALIAMEEESVGWDKSSNKRENFAQKELEKAIKTAKEISSKNSDNEIEAKKFFEFCITENMRNMFRYGNSNVPNSEYRWKRQSSISKSVVQEGKITDETMALIVDDLEFSYVAKGLLSLNIKFSPMVYASQDYENSVGKAYAKFIKTISSQITKQQKNIYNDF